MIPHSTLTTQHVSDHKITVLPTTIKAKHLNNKPYIDWTYKMLSTMEYWEYIPVHTESLILIM